jgi:hypothetical protein
MVVTEVYRLAAESRTSYLFYDAPDSPVLDITFQLSWQTVSVQVKNLLSNPTYLAFKRMEEIIASPPLFSTQDITDRLPRLRNLDQVRDAPLQAFHKEISILQGETRWSHFKPGFNRTPRCLLQTAGEVRAQACSPMNHVSKNLMCICMRAGAQLWVERDRVANLQPLLQQSTG